MRRSSRRPFSAVDRAIEFYVAGPGPTTTRWLVRFGYDGSRFSGWARQPGRTTVEGTIRAGLRLRGLAPRPEAARLEVASRTDRGVSARANALGLSSDLGGAALLARLNTLSPDIVFTGAAAVPAAFRPRSASRRVYRYFDPTPAECPEVWEEATQLFQGQVDVRSLGRGVPSHRPTWRTVDEVVVLPWEGGRCLEVVAPSFVWGMVRKIVGALREVDRGRLALARLQSTLAGRERLTLPMAEPEGLVLWSVEYVGVRWEVSWAGPNRYQLRRLSEALSAVRTRGAVLEAIAATGDPTP